MSVAKRFLVDVPDVDDNLRESLAQHMAFVHLSVKEESKRCNRISRPSCNWL